MLFAFGFGNLAMLGWLAAAAAPLLIHLWSRHRYREAPWAAMQFLLAAMRKNARRLQLQQWLLLAVRTLIILLVVVAVAEPYSERLLAGGRAGPSHKVIVIDGSYSMAYQANGNTNFARAKQLASEMVRASHPGDTFTVILMASAPRLVVTSAVFDRAAITIQIEALVQPQAGADLAKTVSLVRDVLADTASHDTPAYKEVYFLTDLQARTWGEFAKSVEAKKTSEIGAAIAALTERESLVVVDLGQTNASNLAITNVAASVATITSGSEIAFNATLNNFSREPHPQCRTEMLVDDVVVGEQATHVSAGGEASIRFAHRFPSAGNHTVTVRTSGDRLELDNSRSLVVPVRREIRVLCVAGRDGAAKYLSKALNPTPGDDSPIRPIVIAEGDLADAQLSGFDCVFLCNVAQLTASEAERLGRYAESGGGVVTFVGDHVVPASYNALLKSNKIAEGRPTLFPAVIGPIVAQSQFGLDPLEYRHPIVAPFRGRERAGLLTTPVNRHYRLEISKGRPGVEIAAALPSGDPFIVTAPLGLGRTVLVATDGSLSSTDSTNGEQWTAWPTWPSFLPLVRELLAYATGGQQTQWQQLVGTPLGGPIGEGQSQSGDSSKLQMLRPDGRAASVSIRTTPIGSEWSYTDTDISGIYALSGLSQTRIQQFAVNVDAAESNLTKIDTHQLPPAIKVRSGLQSDASSSSVSVATQSDWNSEILWSVFALLFAESFMAWRFGRGAI